MVQINSEIIPFHYFQRQLLNSSKIDFKSEWQMKTKIPQLIENSIIKLCHYIQAFLCLNRQFLEQANSFRPQFPLFEKLYFSVEMLSAQFSVAIRKQLSNGTIGLEKPGKRLPTAYRPPRHCRCLPSPNARF